MAIDPVCKMEVSEDTSHKLERDDQGFYFCSEHCLGKFQNQKSTETNETANSPSESCCSHENQHSEHVSSSSSSGTHTGEKASCVCPMCPGVESDQPGSCPKCGMALEPTTSLPRKSKTIFTCPMHPKIEQDAPGDCPKCGMRLEPKTVTLEDTEDDSELNDMSRRFWVGLILAVPLFLMTLVEMFGVSLSDWISPKVSDWIQLALATPVVLWAGFCPVFLPFRYRGMDFPR